MEEADNKDVDNADEEDEFARWEQEQIRKGVSSQKVKENIQGVLEKTRTFLINFFSKMFFFKFFRDLFLFLLILY